MKIYAVYARVKLIQKPDWLEVFRVKYNNLYDHHITLKQPAYIEQAALPDVQRRLDQLFADRSSTGHITLTFDRLETYQDDGSILLFARQNQQLMNLQREIVSTLGSYSNYMKPELKEYEEHFAPHITLAFHLEERFGEAVADLREDITCVGEISEVVLSCVREITIDETKNPANMTVYSF